MGNYGNTLDRWYRRAAMVVWPRQRAFTVRAQASPAWALDALSARLRTKDIAAAQAMAATLTAFWDRVAGGEQRRGFLTKTLRVAGGLEARLARPARADDDWSIDLPGECQCPLCQTLGQFLADPDQQTIEWPLAKDGRRHVHTRIDTTELPVLHQTRRTGRPYTLVLTKTEEIFQHDRRAHQRDQADLTWLRQSGLITAPRPRRASPRGKRPAPR